MEMDSLVELFCFYEKNMIGRREKKGQISLNIITMLLMKMGKTLSTYKQLSSYHL